MVTFVSLFLNLITGVQPVTLAVSEPVVAVEIQLDGRSLGVLRGEPWTLACDFGPHLLPHELVAIGRDRSGREVMRRTQWVNLPRERASLDILLEERDEGPPRSVRVVWESVEGRPPTALGVTFDGKPLQVTDPRRIPLPSYDPSELHVVAAELVFGEFSYRTERSIGGVYGEVVKTELTAIPVFFEKRKPPRAEEMASWFRKKGKVLRVVAVERGPADVVMVQGPASHLQDRLRWFGRGSRKTLIEAGRSSIPRGVRSGDRLRVLIPTIDSGEGSEVPVDLFPLGPDVGRAPEGIFAPIVYGFVPDDPGLWERAEENPRLRDAVAVAGLAASTAGRPRVVILITHDEADDRSRFEAEEVRRYLEALRVPFVVWTPFPWKEESPNPWGEVQETTGGFPLARAISQVGDLLDHQAVVWVEGLHLPHQVELSPEGAQHLQLAGTSNDFPVDPTFEAENEALWAEVEDEAAEDLPPATPQEAVVSSPTIQERIESAVPVQGAPSEIFSETVDVQVVNVDVVVTDRRGRPVTDLRREDFEIYEDRQPVEISHFAGPATPNASHALPEEPGVGPVEEVEQVTGVEDGDLEGAKARAAISEPLHLVLFLDNSRLRPRDRKLMARNLRAFLDQGLPLGTRLMLITYNGTLEVRQPFTSDPASIFARLDESIRDRNRLAGEDQSRRQRSDQVGELLSDVEAAARSGLEADRLAAADAQASLLAEMEAKAEESNDQTRRLVRDLELLVESLGGIEGRKSLLYVGDGLSFDAFGAVAAGLEKVQQDVDPAWAARAHDSGMRGEHAMASRFRQLTDRANANRVTFYSLTPPIDDQANSVEMGYGGIGLRTTIQDTELANLKETVCLMSSTTGGLCQVGGTQPSQLLDKVQADFGAAYSLAYSPSHPGNGSFHRIQVKVQRPGLRVRHREGYVDRPAEARLRDRLAAALLFDADDNGLGMEIEFEKEEALGNDLHLVQLRIKVPLAGLAFLPTGDPSQRASRLKLLITTMDERSRTTGVQEVPISFQVAADRLEGGNSIVYAHRVHLTLAEGDQRIALGLWDEPGRAGSFLSHRIVVGKDSESD